MANPITPGLSTARRRLPFCPITVTPWVQLATLNRHDERQSHKPHIAIHSTEAQRCPRGGALPREQKMGRPTKHHIADCHQQQSLAHSSQKLGGTLYLKGIYHRAGAYHGQQQPRQLRQGIRIQHPPFSKEKTHAHHEK